MKNSAKPTKGYLVLTFQNKSKRIMEYKVYSIGSNDIIVANRIFRGSEMNYYEVSLIAIGDIISKICFSKFEDLKIYTSQKSVIKSICSKSFLQAKINNPDFNQLLRISSAIIVANSYNLRLWKSEWGDPNLIIYPNFQDDSLDFSLPF